MIRRFIPSIILCSALCITALQPKSAVAYNASRAATVAGLSGMAVSAANIYKNRARKSAEQKLVDVPEEMSGLLTSDAVMPIKQQKASTQETRESLAKKRKFWWKSFGLSTLAALFGGLGWHQTAPVAPKPAPLPEQEDLSLDQSTDVAVATIEPEVMPEQLTRLQAIVRGRKPRREFLAKRNVALALQSLFRGGKARKELADKHDAAKSIQAWFRGLTARKKFEDKRDTAINLQSLFRGHQARKDFHDKRTVARNLQTLERSRQARKELEARRSAVEQIQSLAHVHQARKELAGKRIVAKNLQAMVRGQKARQEMETQKQAAERLQAFAHRNKARKEFSDKRDTAINLQALVRSRQARKELQARRSAVEQIQGLAYVHQARKELAGKRTVAKNLQAMVRGQKARQEMETQKQAAERLQAFAHRNKARKEFSDKRDTAINLQALVRGHQARKDFEDKRTVARNLQTLERSRQARKELEARRNAVPQMQALVRGRRARKEFAFRKGVAALQPAPMPAMSVVMEDITSIPALAENPAATVPAPLSLPSQPLPMPAFNLMAMPAAEIAQSSYSMPATIVSVPLPAPAPPPVKRVERKPRRPLPPGPPPPVPSVRRREPPPLPPPAPSPEPVERPWGAPPEEPPPPLQPDPIDDPPAWTDVVEPPEEPSPPFVPPVPEPVRVVVSLPVPPPPPPVLPPPPATVHVSLLDEPETPPVPVRSKKKSTKQRKVLLRGRKIRGMLDSEVTLPLNVETTYNFLTGQTHLLKDQGSYDAEILKILSPVWRSLIGADGIVLVKQGGKTDKVVDIGSTRDGRYQVKAYRRTLDERESGGKNTGLVPGVPLSRYDGVQLKILRETSQVRRLRERIENKALPLLTDEQLSVIQRGSGSPERRDLIESNESLKRLLASGNSEKKRRDMLRDYVAANKYYRYRRGVEGLMLEHEEAAERSSYQAKEARKRATAAQSGAGLDDHIRKVQELERRRENRTKFRGGYSTPSDGSSVTSSVYSRAPASPPLSAWRSPGKGKARVVKKKKRRPGGGSPGSGGSGHDGPRWV